ncbi:ATP-binding protein [Shewanella sp. NIFS-20-20]|uniref:ATP-binding protein n=1 Tax=Shewanella sp. NIFS-20-20 TaxID=2853806 RepID=UPI001C465086|nr:ATP-binding protein [Shewanella sp. NIFS-20-20]MBV7314200.1 response regulator [Shewanella sp. NIFS-20-20]
MDSNALSQTQVGTANDLISLPAELLANLGRLQAQSIQGESVLISLCTSLAQASGAKTVLLVDINALDCEDLPATTVCWPNEPQQNQILWQQVRQWPLVTDPKCAHTWLHFTVWPSPTPNLVFFFVEPHQQWLSLLEAHTSTLTAILMPMLLEPAVRLQAPVVVSQPSDSNIFQAIVDSFEYMTLVIVNAGNGAKIIYANEAASKISQFSHEQLLNQPLSILFAEHDKQLSGIKFFNEAIIQQQEFDGEIKMTCGDGEYTSMKATLLCIETPEPLMVLMAHDISEEIQMQQAMSRTQKMQALGQLVGGIAHDFNNILGVLKGNLELMQLKNRQDSLDKYLTTGFKACSRGTDLTRRLLQFSRQEQFNAQNCSVNEVISSLKDIFDKSLTSQIHIQMNFAEQLDDICIDRGDLEDAMLNMAINARDAMDGCGELIITTGQEWLEGKLPGSLTDTQVRGGEYVWISVKDSGSGIPLHLVEKIYEPFFTMKDKSKGTGLGLSMIYGFVKRSRGYMSVVDTGPHGTEFKIWFPAQEKKAQQPPSAAEDILQRCPQVKGPFKVLIVDDEAEIIAVVQDYCEMLGMEIETCTDPIAVSRQYSAGNCDANLLITDVLMPGGMNGYQLAKNLQENNSELSVLLISGYIHDIGISEQQEMPFQVLNKPFDIKGLIKAMLKLGVTFIGVDDKDELWKS